MYIQKKGTREHTNT